MKLSVYHQTRYQYDPPATFGVQRVQLRPQSNSCQHIENWQLDVEGATRELTYQDHFGNQTDFFRLEPNVSEVLITIRGEVETFDTSGIFKSDDVAIPAWLYKKQTEITQAGRRIQALVKKFASADKSLENLHAISETIRGKVAYAIGTTDVGTTAEQALSSEQGVCQDHAHIMISVARCLGYQARYVSGYLLINGRVDQSAMHAWCEIYVDGLGWVGFDVSNGVSPDENYIRVAIGADYADAMPVKGLRYGTSDEKLDVQLQIQQ